MTVLHCKEVRKLMRSAHTSYGLSTVQPSALAAPALSALAVFAVIAAAVVPKVTEVAPAEELFTVPRHPYTGALLSAVPVPNPDLSDQRQQIILAGDVPSPVAPPSGCRFHPRCAFAEDDCRTSDTPLRPLPDGPRGA